MNRFVHSTLCHFLQAPITEGGEGGGADEQEDQQQEEEEQEEHEEGEEEEVVVSIAGEKQPEEEEDVASAPSWVKDLRKKNREDQKRIRELEELVRKQEAPKSAAPVLGKKPTMEDDDVDWDADKFEAKLTKWHETKREIEQHEREQQETANKQKAEWEGRLATYNTAKTSLKVKDYDDAEENVKGALDVTQQGITIQGAENAALVFYALGSNPKKLAELAAIKDPIKFAFAIAKLETQLKVQGRKPAPPPEKTVTGNGRISGGDATLERLRAEAEKTGDQSKVVAYKRAQRQKQNA